MIPFRGAMRRTLADALRPWELPSMLNESVTRLVWETRLRRREQIEVAGELASHFSEGLACGVTPSELIAQFGEPRASARRIRDAMIAKRSFIDRTVGHIVRTSAWIAAALVITYSLYSAWLLRQEPNITFDSFEVLQLRIPEAGNEGRAMDVYLAAAEQTDESERRITLLRTLFQHPVLGAPLERASGYADYSSAHSAMFHDAAVQLREDATRAAKRSDVGTFLADARALMAVADHVNESGTMLGCFRSMAILDLAMNEFVSAIENDAESFSDIQLTELMLLVESGEQSLDFVFEAERLQLSDSVQRSFTDAGDGDGVALPNVAFPAANLEAAILGPLVAIGTPSRRTVAASGERIVVGLTMAAAARSPREAQVLLDELLRDVRAGDGQLAVPHMLRVRSTGKLILARWNLQRSRDAAEAAIGLEMFRRAKGEFPKTLDELRKFMCRDIGSWSQDSQPWIYALVEDLPQLWDAQPDGVLVSWESAVLGSPRRIRTPGH